MSLAEEYRRQFVWRDWSSAFAALPPLAGKLVLDLGCGVGDQAAELVARGARVIGFDANEELLAAARARALPNAEFHDVDLRALPELAVPADGIWCSFTAAYFVDLAGLLALWSDALRPGGWIALTEVDDLFAHAPLFARTRELFDAFMREAELEKRYDFRMGRKLEANLTHAEFRITRRLELGDRELAFSGPALPAVVEAWRARLARMKGLQSFCGAEYERLHADFLSCLTHPEHRSQCRVVCVVAAR